MQFSPDYVMHRYETAKTVRLEVILKKEPILSTYLFVLNLALKRT